MNSHIKGMVKDALILFVITVIAGLLLGVGYEVTKEPIAAQVEKAKQEACREVFTDAVSFEEIEIGEPGDALSQQWSELGFDGTDIDEAMSALDTNGNLIGYVVTVTDHEGYSGDIRFMMGVQTDGTLNGISILAISETAGLGMRAEEVLKPQFAGKKVESFEYVKSGAAMENQIDAISGATITTHAVTNGVNAGLYYARTILIEGGSVNE